MPIESPTSAIDVPPCWHPDPSDPASYRWWDGTRWAEHTRQVAAAPTAGYAAGYPARQPTTWTGPAGGSWAPAPSFGRRNQGSLTAIVVAFTALTH